MPMAIPLIAAAMTVSAGVAMATAVAATVAAEVIGGVMIAGGVLSAAGAVTHNSQLTKWGTVLSMAGGVGALANGAWGAAASNVAEQSGMDLAADAGAGGANAVGAAGDAVSGMDMAADAPGIPQAPPGEMGPPQGVVDSKMNPQAPTDAPVQVDPAAAPDVAAPPVNTPMKPLVPDAPAAAPTTVSTMGEGADAADAAVAPTVESAPAATTGASGAWDDPVYSHEGSARNLVGINADVTGVPAASAPNDWFSKASEWVRQNKDAAKIGADTLGGAAKMYGEQDAYKTRMQIEQDMKARDRARFNQSVAGANTAFRFVPTTPKA